MLTTKMMGKANWSLKRKDHAFQWCKQRDRFCTGTSCSSNSLSVHFLVCLWPGFTLLLHRAMGKVAEYRLRRQTSQHVQAEGLSTTSVHQMPSTVSPMGGSAPRIWKAKKSFLLFSEVQTPLFWGLIIYAFLSFLII